MLLNEIFEKSMFEFSQDVTKRLEEGGEAKAVELLRPYKELTEGELFKSIVNTVIQYMVHGQRSPVLCLEDILVQFLIIGGRMQKLIDTESNSVNELEKWFENFGNK